MANPDFVEGSAEVRAMPWLSCEEAQIAVATVCGEMIENHSWVRRRLARRPGSFTPSGTPGPGGGSMPGLRNDWQSA